MSAVAASPAASATAMASSPSACPIDHSKLSKEQWEQWSKQHTAPRPPLVTQQPQLAASPTPQQQPIATTVPLACDSAAIDSAPAPHTSAFHSVGDVFPDSKPAPTQRLPLSSRPIASSIPRSGTDPSTAQPHTVWTYPSPQRFYNAMQRKGWQADERDMVHVVSIHNTVNEQTWARVRATERSLHPACAEPKLARFKGRPNDLSVKARVKGLVGYERPFDRHDWVVDRCGKEVRYVIDFYGGSESEMGSGHAAALHIDARPAVDDPEGAYDRLRLFIREWW